LTEGEQEKAAAVLETILGEFPHSRELQQAKKSLDQATQRRSDAQNQIARAKESFDRCGWREGAERCLHAVPFAARDPVIRAALVAALELAAAHCVETNWREAEYLLECMKSVQPSAVFPSETIHRIEKGKQEEFVLECLAEVNELEAQGDLEEALLR